MSNQAAIPQIFLSLFPPQLCGSATPEPRPQNPDHTSWASCKYLLALGVSEQSGPHRHNRKSTLHLPAALVAGLINTSFIDFGADAVPAPDSFVSTTNEYRSPVGVIRQSVTSAIVDQLTNQ